MTENSLPARDNPRRSWQEIAAELSRENDPQRIVELSHELNEVMLEDERRKVQDRVEGHHE